MWEKGNEDLKDLNLGKMYSSEITFLLSLSLKPGPPLDIPNSQRFEQGTTLELSLMTPFFINPSGLLPLLPSTPSENSFS